MYDAVLSETVTITGHGGDAIEAYSARPLAPGPVGGCRSTPPWTVTAVSWWGSRPPGTRWPAGSRS
jgi:hypothetical protein